MDEAVLLEERGPVATLTLNRPDVRNAFNAEVIRMLRGVCDRLARRDDLRALVIRGSGRAFCAGADVDWMRASLALSEEENRQDAFRMSDMFHALDTLPQMVIARVHGACLGGGMGLIAAADIVVAADDAVFGFTEVKLGIIPAVISRVVIRKIGRSWARALYLTGERFNATVAKDAGLVHWIVSEAELDAAVEVRLAEMLSSGPMAVKEAKRLVRELQAVGDGAMRLVTAPWIARLRTSPEGQEGLKAFLEKRRPSWRSNE